MPGICLPNRTLALVLLLSVCGCNEASETDPSAAEAHHAGVFVDKTFEDAKAEAAADKLLFVDVVTPWCIPCKRMDKTTWPNEDLVQWFEEHVVAIKIDTKENTWFAFDYEIRQWPTFLVFKDGREIARDTGFKTAGEILNWLEKELEDAEKDIY